MMIGNYMLLNLFLAILLKFISENGEGAEDDEATKEPVDSNDASKAERDGNQSDPLNSSNSNIEEEFECIKLQLQEFSNMNIAAFEKQRKQEAKEAKMRERNSS